MRAYRVCRYPDTEKCVLEFVGITGQKCLLAGMVGLPDNDSPERVAAWMLSQERPLRLTWKDEGRSFSARLSRSVLPGWVKTIFFEQPEPVPA